jgi:dTMP kinase
VRARWIAFEGGEGSGKSTQAARLAEVLDAVLSREPGGTAVGGRVREVLLDPSVSGMDARAEALLMAADRAQHVAEVVRPALAAGRFVVSDRSAYSSLAYQGHGRGLGAGAVRRLCDWATDSLWPDLAILLEVPAAVSDERRKDPPDRMEAAGDDFHERVADGFRELVSEEPDRWLVVDGTGSMDEVAGRVRVALDAWTADHA